MAGQDINSIPKGLSDIEVGVYVAPTSYASATALSVGINAEVIYITAWNVNTDTVWFGLDSSTTSGTGFPFFSGTSVTIPYREMPLYFQSEGGSSVISYIALGKAS